MNNKSLDALEKNIQDSDKFTIRDKQALDLVDDLRAERQKVSELEREKNYWKECYDIALNHLKQIEHQYFIEHGGTFCYEENAGKKGAD